jgi:hypothetical protein
MSNNNGLIPASSVPSVYSSTPYATPAPSVVNNIVSGTIPPLATNYNNDGCYFIKKGEPIDGPLISQVNILSADLSSTARITVTGNSDLPYKGAITLNSGANNSGPSQVILTGRTAGQTTSQIEIGDNAQTNNLLIAGPSGLSQVFDGVYNPPVGVELINITGPFVSTNYPNGWLTSSPNDGSITGSFTGGTANSFNVPVTGLYMLQATIKMAPETTSSSAFSLQITVNTVPSPFTPIGGLVIGQSTPLSSDDTNSFYCWNCYIPLVSGELYNLTWRMLSGGGVFLPPNLVNNLPYSDLKLQLIKIG